MNNSFSIVVCACVCVHFELCRVIIILAFINLSSYGSSFCFIAFPWDWFSTLRPINSPQSDKREDLTAGTIPQSNDSKLLLKKTENETIVLAKVETQSIFNQIRSTFLYCNWGKDGRKLGTGNKKRKTNNFKYSGLCWIM